MNIYIYIYHQYIYKELLNDEKGFPKFQAKQNSVKLLLGNVILLTFLVLERGGTLEAHSESFMLGWQVVSDSNFGMCHLSVAPLSPMIAI